MRIIEIATVLSISVLGIGAGQNVTVTNTSGQQAPAQLTVINQDAEFDNRHNHSLLDRQGQPGTTVSPELQMLPPIDLVPVGAFSFSF